MRYYVIAGEASGDLHGSNLIKELQAQDPRSEFRGWGGDLMEAAGTVLVKHYRDLAFMGFIEVVSNLRTIFKNLAFCKNDITAWKPDALILIDYPGFNLRIAEWAHEQGFRVIYYISPQVWAWKENRVKKMKTCIDLMLVILPFEKEYYRNKWNWEVSYVGHPLVEVVDAAIQANSSHASVDTVAHTKNLNPPKIIALLPGSRKQEIRKKLPVMLELSKDFPDYQFVVARAPGLSDAFYEPLLAPYPNVEGVSNQTYALLLRASAALVTSGTATLETALFAVPEVVCYKGNPVSYQIARRLITIKYISLVNLILDRPVVKELIQNDLNRENLKQELDLLLHDPAKKARLAADYQQLKELLSQGGKASANAATLIREFIHPATSSE